MATTIPYDPSLILGQVVEMERIDDLMKIAALQKPLEVVHEKLNNLLETIYRLKSVENEMKSIGVDEKSMNEFKKEIDNLENTLVGAAVEYGTTATSVYQSVEAEVDSQSQKTISYSIESPLDYGKSEVTQFPLSFDSLEFDVQYVRNEKERQTSEGSGGQSNSNTTDVSEVRTATQHQGTKQVTETRSREVAHQHTTTTGSWWWKKTNTYTTFSNENYDVTVTVPYTYETYKTNRTTTDTANNTVNSILKQYQNHDIEGTIVISAKATHKNADIISPFKLDPLKAVTAWNYTYPDDLIDTKPENIMKAALENYKEHPSKKKTLDIISGCTKASSFVGFVHLLHGERTESSQSTSSKVDKIKESMEYDLCHTANKGGFGNSKSMQKTAKSLNSSSFISTHANIVCHGIIPSIVVNDVKTSVKQMAPDPQKIMDQQEAIAGASGGGGDSGEGGDVEETTEGGKKGAQFKALNSEFMKNTVTNLTDTQSEANKVIDTNSMMAAFEDFVAKAMEGGCGIPTNFYIKHLTKNDIAKSYIRKFYPNGLKTANDRRMGMMGQSSEDDAGGE